MANPKPVHKFEKGNSGRAPGTINKNTRLVKDVFAQVFSDMQEDPKTSLKTWAKENRQNFYNLVTKLIPVQLDHAGEVVQRIIIEDNNNCQSLIKEDESNTGIQG